MAAIDQKPSALSVFSKGLLIENPTLRQMLGLCPTLAVTTAVTNGIGMGRGRPTFVLVSTSGNRVVGRFCATSFPPPCACPPSSRSSPGS